MLKDRLRTSAILIVITLGLVYLDANMSLAGAEGLWLLPLLLFLALGTAWDMASLLAGSGRAINKLAAVVATAIVTLSACTPLLWPLVGSVYPPNCPVGKLGWIVIGSVAAVFVILIGEMTQYGKVLQRPGVNEWPSNMSAPAARFSCRFTLDCRWLCLSRYDPWALAIGDSRPC